jgi:hypothetical protein
MKKQNNIIVFATYWNEKDWIKSSLKQIDKLNPKEIIICDGCFDPKKVNKSTDGTREIIKKWVSRKDNAKMISAIRVSRLKAIYLILKGHNKSKWYYIFTPARAKALYLTLTNNIYRVNQALTFQKMISLSNKWKPEVWTTNFDCDQFYSDEMFKDIIKLINSKNDFGILTGKENTFFKNFNEYTETYEKREYNNMPHKIYKNTTIMPTRGTIIEDWNLETFNLKKFFKADFYINRVKIKKVGRYNHYKFKFNKKRFKEGYQLGNRKAPILKDYKFKKYLGKHPKIIIEDKMIEKFEKIK